MIPREKGHWLALFVVFLYFALGTPLYGAQKGGFPENYWTTVNSQIEELQNETLNRSVTRASTSYSSSIDNIDISDFPSIKVFVSVNDSEGKPVEGLTEANFKVWEEKLLSPEAKVKFSVKELKEEKTKADIIFCIDTTGSMSPYIEAVKSNINAFVSKLIENNVDFKLAAITFGDSVRKSSGWYSDGSAFQSWISSLSAYGGNDTPEDPLDAIILATTYDFREDAQKIIVLITDAPAHVAGDGGDSSTTATFASALSALSSVKDLKLYWSSPETQYSVLGSSLGWPFTGDTLLGELVDKLVVKYLITYTTPWDKKDGSLRYVYVNINLGATAKGEYKAPEVLGVLKGTVWNRDEPPKPLEDVIVKVIDPQKFAESVAAGKVYMPEAYLLTDSEGKYSVELKPGKYVVEVYKPDYLADSAEVEVKEDEEVVRDFQLGLADITYLKNAKRDLVNKLSNWGAFFGISSPFADEESEVLAWVNSLPDTDASDAQAEALKRLILAEEAVYQSASFAVEDGGLIGSHLTKAVFATMDLFNLFKGLEDKLKALMDGVPVIKVFGLDVTSGFKAALRAVINKYHEIIKNFVDGILDGIKLLLPDGMIKNVIFPVIKDTFDFLFADPKSLLGDVSDFVGKQIGKNVVVPLYGNSVDDFILLALDKSKSIKSSSEELYYQAKDAWSSSMDAMREHFNEMKSREGTASTVTDVLSVVGDVIGTLKGIADVVGLIPVPQVQAVKVTLEGLDKAVKTFQVGADVSAVGIVAYHLVNLPQDVNSAVGAAYNLSAIRSLRLAYVPVSAERGISDSALTRSLSDNFESALSNYLNSLSQISDFVKNDDFKSLLDFTKGDLIEADNQFEDSLRIVEATLNQGYSLNKDVPTFDAYFLKASRSFSELRLERADLLLRIITFTLKASTFSSPDDEGYKDFKEQFLSYLELLKSEIEQGGANITAALSVMRYFPVVAVVDKVEITPEEVNEEGQEITVKAFIKNISDYQIDGLKVVLRASKYFSVDQAEKEIGSLGAGESVEVSWTLTYNGEKNSGALYNIVCLSTPSRDCFSVRGISIPVGTSDSDGDGMPDWWEEKYGLNPEEEDSREDLDGDGLTNYTEYLIKTDPSNVDTDGDGVNDFVEWACKSSPTNSGDVCKSLSTDFNGDGQIDVLDILFVSNRYGEKMGEAGYSGKADLIGDGVIDLFDVISVARFWGAKLTK